MSITNSGMRIVITSDGQEIASQRFYEDRKKPSELQFTSKNINEITIRVSSTSLPDQGLIEGFSILIYEVKP